MPNLEAMRIEQLNLMAYGPFTDKVLEFDAANFHVIYGPNEAGKSSALRALTALLYGVSNTTKSTTADDQLHKKTDLRIGGVLRSAGGDRLEVVRRKGTKKTLMAPNGGTLDDQSLMPYIQGVSKELFTTLFGIDHKALVQGGKDIVEQKGDVGQALFSAASGSSALHQVLAELDKQAQDLFKPTGRTSKINVELSTHAAIQKELKSSSLASSHWDAHTKELERSSAELEQITIALKECNTQLNRLQRIQRVLPFLGLRRELVIKFEKLNNVVVLPEDFSERRRQAESELHNSISTRDRLNPQLNELQVELSNLSVKAELLEQAESIEGLHARLDSYRNGLLEQPALEAEEQQLTRDARAILQQIRPDLDWQEVGTLRPILSRKTGISKLVQEHPLISSNLKQTQSDLAGKKQNLAAAQSEFDKLASVGSTTLLRHQISASRKLGDLDSTIEGVRSERNSLQVRCDAELSRLNYWSGSLDQVSTLRLPEAEAIEQFNVKFEEQAAHSKKIESDKTTNANALLEIQKGLGELERVGQVVTESDMLSSRKERDALWQLLRRRWLQNEDVDAQSAGLIGKNSTLHDTFEHRLAQSDELADRLRREADRVLMLAKLQSQLEAEQSRAQTLTTDETELTKNNELLENAWQSLWSACQLTPGTPRQMRAWMVTFESLRTTVERVQTLTRELGEFEDRTTVHIDLLSQQLNDLGLSQSKLVSLESMLSVSEVAAENLEAAAEERNAQVTKLDQLKADIVELEAKHSAAARSLEEWNVTWVALLQEFTLPASLQAMEMNELIDQIRILFEKQAEASKRQTSITRVNKSNEAFQEQVTQMLESLAPEYNHLSSAEAVGKLKSLLSENSLKQAKKLQLEKDVERAEKDISECTVLIDSMQKVLSSLCREAKCEDPAQLIELEKRSAEYQGLKRELSANDSNIANVSDGSTIEELQDQANDVEADELPSIIAQFRNRVADELEPKRAELIEKVGREKSDIEKMNGSGDAALLAESASASLASIRSNAEQYAKVKLAAKLLRDHIEQYRQENQGPLISRASDYFAKLTLNSFEQLMMDFNDSDIPVLTGVRQTGKGKVKVEGMSSGTLDQLYLALRLASIEAYAAGAEPMPFIVDDVLIEFDDERSMAALQALADMSETTQIIVFTHHSQILNQATQIKGVQTHML